MHIRAATAVPTTLNTRRLIWLRSIAIPGPALLLLLAAQFYDLQIPALPLIVTIGVVIAVNILTWRRLQAGSPIGNNEFFAQMLIDVAALTTVVYYAGGASNPFAFFFLLPLTITATVLPRSYTWAMAAITALCYLAMLFVRVPTPIFMPNTGSQSIFDLHVAGMWLGFVLIAILIAHYVAGMGETLRAHDRRLAEAREQALNDERMLALATLAAGAAHELSTPLGTMAILVGELTENARSEGNDEARKQLQILKTQIDRCKESLSVMSTSSGTVRAGHVEAIPVATWINDAAEDTRRVRPESSIDVALARTADSPKVVIDLTLKQALLNIMHNAVDVSPRSVEVAASWTDDTISIRVMDRGPGIDSARKAGGLGVGLMISRAALQQFDGRVDLRARDGGGSIAEVLLPRHALTGAAS